MRARGVPPDLHFLLLGAGFLLVETKGIADLGLLFGGTWWTVNAVIGSMLGMAVLSTLWVAWRRPVRVWPAYVGIATTLCAAYLLNPGVLLGLPLSLARLVGCLVVAAPVAFSGVIFAVSLSRSMDCAHALGSNLLGSVLGGLLEYTSLSFGVRSLSLLAIGIYALSALPLLVARGSRRMAPGA